MQTLILWLQEFMTHDVLLFHIGKNEFTLGQLLAMAIGVLVLLFISRMLHRLIVNRLLIHSNHIDLSTRYTIAALVRYTVLVVGSMAILQTAGINLTAFSVVAGAVGVGVGFGLQNIVSNFISGLIVMFERPVRIGDRIELAGIEGDVLRIGARATQIMTAEGSVVIMPNQKFITEPVKNWVDHEAHSPVILNVIVEKDSNLRQTASLLDSAVREHPGIMKKNATQIWLTGVSGNATFKILAWARASMEERNKLMHELYLAISESLASHGIRLA